MQPTETTNAAPATYLTTTELVEYLAARYPKRYNVRTLNNWRSNKEDPPRGPVYYKQGGRVVYKLEDVQAWEAAGGAMRRGRAA